MAVISGPRTLSNREAAQHELDLANAAETKAAETKTFKEKPILMEGSDGEWYHVPPSSYNAAIQNNWKVLTEKDIEREHKIAAGVAATSQLKGGAKTFGNEALLGIPNYISNKEAGEEQASIDEEIRNRVAERDPWTHAIASTAGFLAPLAIPGVGEVGEAARVAALGGKVAGKVAGRLVERGLAETAIKGTAEVTGKAIERGLAETAIKGTANVAEHAIVADAAATTAKAGIEASLSRKVAANAAKYAAEGATYGAPKAIVQTAYGDYEQAAETMLWNIGLSGVLGASSELVSSGVKSIGSRTISSLEEKISPIKLIDEVISKDLKLQNKIETPLATAYTFQKEIREKFPDIMTGGPKEKVTEIFETIRKYGAETSIGNLNKIQSELNIMKSKAKSEIDNSLIDIASGIVKNNITSGSNLVYQTGALPEKFAESITNMINDSSQKILTGGGTVAGAVAGSAIGGVTGSVGGAAAGAYIGKKTSEAVNNVISSIIKHYGIDKKFSSYLFKELNNSFDLVGGLMAKESKFKFEKQLEQIPKYLTEMPAKSVVLGTHDAISEFLGSEAKGLTNDARFKKISDKLTLAANDENTSTKIGHIASIFVGTDEKLAQLVSAKKFTALDYLVSQLPKNPNEQKPFQVNNWKPSKQEQISFNNKLAVVMNPMSVFDKVRNHTITNDEVITLVAVYPKVYAAMIGTVMQAAYNPATGKVSHKTRVSASKLTGIQLDGGNKNIGSIQQALNQNKAEQNLQTQLSKSGGSASNHPKMNKAPTLQTESQRRTYGGKHK